MPQWGRACAHPEREASLASEAALAREQELATAYLDVRRRKDELLHQLSPRV